MAYFQMKRTTGSGDGISGNETVDANLPTTDSRPNELAQVKRKTVDNEPDSSDPSTNQTESVHGMTGAMMPSDKEYDPDDPWFHLLFQVIDSRGNPIPKRLLRLSYSFPIEKPISAQSHTLPFEILTDEEGRVDRPFALGSESTTAINIWLKDPKGSGAALIPNVVIALRGEIDLGTIPLLSPSDRDPIPLVTGTVRSDEGDLVPGALAALTAQNAVEGEPLWPGWAGNEIQIDDAGNFSAYGPLGANTLKLHFFAPGFHDKETEAFQVPRGGMEVVMTKRLVLTGQLVVPSNGPDITSYGIWIAQEGGAIGVTPREDGTFEAQGTRHALRLRVSNPTMGSVLYDRELVVVPSQGESLGTIDLTHLVQVIDFVILDDLGAPIPYLAFELSGEGLESLNPMYHTDGEGRYFSLLPEFIHSVRLSVQGWKVQNLRVDQLVGNVSLER